MQRLVTSMCEGACNLRGGCYEINGVPTCRCRSGYSGASCGIVDAVKVDTITEDSSSLLPVIVFVVFLLLLLVGVGIVVVYRFCLRRSEPDRDIEFGGVPRNEAVSLWQKLMKQELEDLKNNYEKVVESEAKKEEELSNLKEELTLEKEKNRETILTLKAENAANERVIQQLLDKLTSIGSNEVKNSTQ